MSTTMWGSSTTAVFVSITLLLSMIGVASFGTTPLRIRSMGPTTTVPRMAAPTEGEPEDGSNNYDLQRITIGDREFWAQQKALITEMTDAADERSKAAMREKFSERRLALVGDTAYIGMFLFCLLWLINENPFVPLSYSIGALMGVAYAYGLGKYVETVGGSIDDTASTRGAGVGEARFAFLILLFIIVGRFRDTGIQEVPAISGFFTYQLASLRQGLKEIND